jgi:hypothetical protein
MKRIPLLVYLVVLLVSLVLAYVTWTEGPKKPEGDATLLACGKGEIRKITLREKERKVVFDRRKSAWTGETVWWVEALRLPFKPAEKPDEEAAEEMDVDVASMGPVEDEADGGSSEVDTAKEEWTASESFLGNEKLREALEGFCPWKGLRSLGKLGEDKREEFGLKDTRDSLVLDLRGKARTFRIGKKSFGPGDRYVEDEKTGEIFLVKGQSIKDLLYPKSRYMERSLHSFKEKEVARIRVREGSRAMELIHRFSPEGGDEGWAEAGKKEDPKELFKNWVHKVFTLRPVDYVVPEEGASETGHYGCQSPSGAVVAAAISFLSDTKEIGFLTVYKKAGEQDKVEYYACTENTNAVVKVSKIQAENLLKDMADLLPEAS